MSPKEGLGAEDIVEAIKEITGEHKAYNPERRAENRVWWKIFGPVFGVLAGIVLTSSITFLRDCNPYDITTKEAKYATKVELAEEMTGNDKEHVEFRTAVKDIKETTSTILTTLTGMQKEITKAKRKSNDR